MGATVKTKLERRAVMANDLRVQKRMDSDDGAAMPMIRGHAAVFNSKSELLSSWMPFREKVVPGAFKDTIAMDDIRALWNHNPDHVLGRNTAGTLRLNEDGQGLAVEIDPPDAQWARDLCRSIERGDVSQMSIGFDCETDSWSMEDGEDMRTLSKVKLYDVSPVTFPAYPETDVSTRSLEDVAKDGRARMGTEWAAAAETRRLELLARDI